MSETEEQVMAEAKRIVRRFPQIERVVLVPKLEREIARSLLFQADQATAHTAELAKAQKENQDLIHVLQTYQPAGSPPPGDAVILAQWILRTMRKENAALKDKIDSQRSCIGLIELHNSDQSKEIDQLRVDLKTAREENAALKSTHCNDCCCARSWRALNLTEYTGKSIPQHITELRASLQTAQAELQRWRLAYGTVDSLKISGEEKP